MTIEQQHPDSTKKNINTSGLKIIRNVRFTDREIDTIACLLGGRAYKKIASLLSISPKTVELHVRNVMSKLGCSSREGIIDFIEKSDKFTLVKIHYSNILIKTTFEQELKKLLSITKESNISCLIFHYEKQTTKNSFVYQLEQHLNIAGIKTFSKVWVKGKSESFLINKIATKQVNCIIYVMSSEFIEQLTVLGYEIQQEVANLIHKVKDSLDPIIFLLPKDNTSLEINKNQPNLACVNLAEQGNYYFLVFELLKKLLPSNNIDPNIIAFKKQYELLHSDSELQKWPKEDTLATEMVAIKDHNKKGEIFSFKRVTLFFILLICFGFTVFKVYKEINPLANQSQSTKTKITDNKPNVLPENQQKTFNLPPRNSKFTGREDSLAQIKKQLNKQKIGVITQAISGLGGVGKTNLATEFAYQASERNDYGIVLWIGAETTNAINSAYEELAKFLQIDVRGFNPDKIQAIVHNELTKKYKRGKILFILDNVPDHYSIQDYILRLYKQLATNFTLHILITSRSQYWPEGDPLILDTFTPEEAVEFIKKHLPNEQENSIINLTETLHCFPLALSQATAYIKAHTNIDDYIELCTTKQKDYLDKFPNDKNQYTESLWKTWNIALAKLSAPAKEILFISSYLYPDDISFAFFDNLTVEERANAIEDLRKHSFIIITNNNQSFKIHRLLQEVIRTTINSDTKHNIFRGKFYELTKAINLLKNKFDFSYAKQDKWGLCNQYLMHAQSLAEHEINIGNEFLHQGMQLYSQVAMYLTYVQQDNNNAKEVWEKIATLVKQYYGNDKSSELVLASINTHVGRVMHEIGNLNLAKKYLEKSTLVYQAKIPNISPNVEKLLPYLRWEPNLVSYDGIKCDQSLTLLTLCDVCVELINFKMAKDFCESGLKILDECKQINLTMLYRLSFLNALTYIHMCVDLEAARDIINTAKIIADKNFPNHLTQAYAYQTSASLLYYMGLYNEAKEDAEKSLKIRLSMFSKDHYRVGYNRFLLGLILCSDNHIDEGLVNLAQVETIYDKNFKDGFYPSVFLSFVLLYINMSYAFEMNHEYDKALQYFIKAQKKVEKNRKPYMFYLNGFHPVEKLPLVLESKNVHYYMQALDLTKKIFGDNHIRVARYHYLLGLVLKNIGDDDKARQHYHKALDITKKQQLNDKTLIIGNQKNIEIIQNHLRF